MEILDERDRDSINKKIEEVVEQLDNAGEMAEYAFKGVNKINAEKEWKEVTDRGISLFNLPECNQIKVNVYDLSDDSNYRPALLSSTVLDMSDILLTENNDDGHYYNVELPKVEDKHIVLRISAQATIIDKKICRTVLVDAELGVDLGEIDGKRRYINMFYR